MKYLGMGVVVFVVKISISRSQQLRMVEGERILFNKEYNIYRG